MRKTILWIFILIALMTSSCSPALAPSAGIRITDVMVAIGGAEGSVDQQVISYEVTLQNATQNDVILHWLEPVLSEKISDRLVDDSLRVSVEKTLGANSSLIVAGQFRVDSSDVTKEQITSWEPFFKDMLVSIDLKLPLPPQAGG
jgi:hypothetical protein